MSIKLRVPLFKFRVPLFPFLHLELRGGPSDIVRVELHSPRVEIPLALLWLRPRPSVRWATTDEIVACVADAIDAYRLTQDDASEEPETSAEQAIHTILGDESGRNIGNRLCVAQGHDISDVLREAARDLDAHEKPTDDAAEPEPDGWREASDVTLAEWRACPWWEWRYAGKFSSGVQVRGAPLQGDESDGWRDVATVTLDEWLACPWWEWRLTATAGHGRQSSRETQSVPVLGQVRRATIQGDESDGWRDVFDVTPEEWAAWRWWAWRADDGTGSAERMCSRRSTHWCDGRGVPEYGHVRRVPLLEWPEMSGDRDIPGRDITWDMIAAWPVWVVDCGSGERIVRASEIKENNAKHLGCEWRPLRLPGMSTDPATLGEIAGEDMTPEHFERVREWEWLEPRNKWVMWALGMHGVSTLSGADPHTRWRPAVFGETPATWKNGGFTPAR